MNKEGYSVFVGNCFDEDHLDGQRLIGGEQIYLTSPDGGSTHLRRVCIEDDGVRVKAFTREGTFLGVEAKVYLNQLDKLGWKISRNP